jgi:hypothetical protein
MDLITSISKVYLAKSEYSSVTYGVDELLKRTSQFLSFNFVKTYASSFWSRLLNPLFVYFVKYAVELTGLYGGSK